MIKEVSRSSDGIVVFSMKNEYLELKVTNLGCTIMEILMPDKDGNIDDIVLGYDNVESYKTCPAYFGSVIGRVCNRIKDGRFILNNKEYTLIKNNGSNHLHGGKEGFNHQIFKYEIIDDKTIVFIHRSKDGHEGYPGDLIVMVTYRLADNKLHINYHGATNKDTLVNLTNHTYFNLSGKEENILNHKLMIDSNGFMEIDSEGLATGKIIGVENTPFDFREGAVIKNGIDNKHPQIQNAGGYDHSFLLDSSINQVELYHDKTKRKVSMTTSLPQVQIYTGNFIDNIIGKKSKIYPRRAGVSLESQFMPNEIWIDNDPKSLLKKCDVYNQTTIYTFEVCNYL